MHARHVHRTCLCAEALYMIVGTLQLASTIENTHGTLRDLMQRHMPLIVGGDMGNV